MNGLTYFSKDGAMPGNYFKNDQLTFHYAESNSMWIVATDYNIAASLVTKFYL